MVVLCATFPVGEVDVVCYKYNAPLALDEGNICISNSGAGVICGAFFYPHLTPPV